MIISDNGVFSTPESLIFVARSAMNTNMLQLSEDISIVSILENKSTICKRILSALPDWFGIESSILEYAENIDKMPMWGVQVGNEIKGFIGLKMHFEHSAEVYVMGIEPDYHRQGLGSALLAAAEKSAKGQGVRFLQVKTLSASASSPEYDLTRQFYLNRGFFPLEEFPDLWDPHNPCLLMGKCL